MRRQLAQHRPSASLIISLVALFVALGDSSSAATIRDVILGRSNASSSTTHIAGRLATPVLTLTNTGSGSAARFAVASSAPPFTVNSPTEVTNLNAGLVDGEPSSDFWSVDGNAKTNLNDYLGTSDSEPLAFGTGGVTYAELYPSGELTIGTTDGTSTLSPASQLFVDSGDLTASTPAIEGVTAAGNSIIGQTTSGVGVQGTSVSDIGVLGTGSRGVVGTIGQGSCPGPGPGPGPGSYAVGGCGSTSGLGVYGSSSSVGVYGTSPTGTGVHGDGATGIVGSDTSACASASGSALPLCGSGCTAPAGVVGCANSEGFGVIGEINHPAGGAAAAALEAINAAGGDLFLGLSGTTRVARINGQGKGFFDGGTENGGADYADAMRADRTAKLRPGDVLAIDPRSPDTVGLTSTPDSTLVAGVYSTRPAVLGIGDAPLDRPSTGRVPVALVGVVPTLVSAENGPVRVGDLLTSASTPGYAMRAKPVIVDGVAVYPEGTILGKALQPLRGGKGLIDVLVTLR